MSNKLFVLVIILMFFVAFIVPEAIHEKVNSRGTFANHSI